ncbi:MAG: M3 family oligoendopeptidase [Thermaerobacter sp.]|nr:M3 family oligoendopeptidase [Thermaerobacter sp.]
MELRWDLTPLYPSFTSDAFQNDLQTVTAELAALKERYTWSHVPDPAAEMTSYLLDLSALTSRMVLLQGYAGLTFQADTTNETAIRYVDQLDMLMTELTEPTVKFRRYLTTLRDLEGLLNTSPFLMEHSFLIKDQLEKASYMLSDREEVLLALLQTTGSSAWSILQSKLTAGLMITLDVEGEQKTLPLSMLRNLAKHESAEVRKSAYIAELKAYESIDEAIASALNSIKGEVLTVAKLRGYPSPLAQSAATARLDMDSLNAMISAMRDKLPAFRKYLRRKGEILGHQNGLPFYDLFAPVTTSSLKFTWEEGAAFITRHFGSYSQELADYAMQVFAGSWVDVLPRKGKVGGAFCASVHPIKESRILMNYTGSFSDVSTLAHELGHGYHNAQVFCESVLNSDYPMPVAETASIFCETIVIDAALKEVTDQDKVDILEKSLAGHTQLIVDILSRFIFETNVFEARREAPLSVSQVKTLMLAAQQEAYGDGLDENALHPYMWLCKSHYYSAGFNFYNYPYAFGLLFGKGLYAQYLDGHTNFHAAYNQLLNNTTRMPAKEVAATMNIDTTAKDFWLKSLGIIERDIEEFLRLTEHLVPGKA